MTYLINAGSVQDIRSSLRLAEPKMTIKQLLQDKKEELQDRQRISVINMLEAAIHRKQKLKNAKAKPGVCKVCGCKEMSACFDEDTGSCWWVEEDLCSACATPSQKQKAIEQMQRMYGGKKSGLASCLQ